MGAVAGPAGRLLARVIVGVRGPSVRRTCQRVRITHDRRPEAPSTQPLFVESLPRQAERHVDAAP